MLTIELFFRNTCSRCIMSLWFYFVNSFICFPCLSSDEYYLLRLLLCLTRTFLLLWMLFTLGISQAVGTAERIPVINGREWSVSKLVISVVSSSGYLRIFISMLCVRWFLRLRSSSSLSGNSVEIALVFLNAEKVVSHAVLEFLEWMQIKSIASSIIHVS